MRVGSSRVVAAAIGEKLMLLAAGGADTGGKRLKRRSDRSTAIEALEDSGK